MTLRSRLLLAFAAVVVVLAAAVAFVVNLQRDFLTAQVDRELLSAGPLAFPLPAAPPEFVPPGPLPATPPTNGPLSDLFFVAVSPLGETAAPVQGRLLEDAPELDVDALLGADRAAPVLRTEPGLGTEERFRVLAVPASGGGWFVVATSLRETDAAIARLRSTLLAGAAFVVVAMGLTTWWVIRLGIRPIREATEAAEAIASGERERRIDVRGSRTEAADLGTAFNAMLDQRDAAETRLRRFVADASHELRTPLTSVGGYLDLLSDGALDDEREQEVLRRLRAESARMRDLVEDLLLLAHLDEGRPLRSEPVDVAAVVSDAASDARAVQPEREVRVDLGGEAEALVIGDEMRLRQLVAGLVQNSLVHTPVTATISLTVRSSAREIVVEVADDGPGLPPGLRETVFDRFSRGDASRTRRTGGSGLGLAIASSIASAHHGSLSVAGPPAGGCVFSLVLPRGR